ncbi:MAG: hypothetical protein IPM24_13445 [Bryobacterales bacterium]|nr:hypothetical protein [Bryobacterales bacterium]
MNANRFLGITVMPEYIQTETAEGVLDRLAAAGVNAVTTSPYLMEEATEAEGSREPPADAGAGGVRLLDRPLWGKRELFVRTAPSFAPDPRLYRGLRYQPSPASELTRREGRVIHEFIRGAQARHMKVYLQVQAAIPPGYRVQFGGPSEEDRARLPDGRIPPRRLANNGSLASPEIRRYTEALLRDLLRVYPDVDGLRVDWPEYPPYFLDDVFLDFSPHAEAAAKRMGYDSAAMRRAAGALYRKLHGGLTNADLEAWTDPDGGRHNLLRALADEPSLAAWLRFKADLVANLLAGFRQAMNEAGGGTKELLPNAFPPPLTIASGMDFARIAQHVSGASVKLYTMHWPMMLRFWGDALREANPAVDPGRLVRALVRWFDLADDAGFPRLEDYTYPGPETAHPVGAAAQARKIRQAQREASGRLPVYVLAHGYGPLADFRARLDVAWRSSGGRMWINRYAYLNDAKLDAVREVTR